jgi:hypothetical protein
MPASIDVARWERYFRARDDGLSARKAAGVAHISLDAAYRFENGDSVSGQSAARALGRTHIAGDIIPMHVDDAAQKALDDFAFFRERYFGRRAVPWQADAAYQVLGALESGDKEFLVVNAPPGLGKSTLFTHDVPAWLICRKRSIRILIGSATGRQARLYVKRLRRTLERRDPMVADPETIRTGGAFNAVSTLAADFGTFKPEGKGNRWTDAEFTVVQNSEISSDDKENTVAAYGKDEEFLGGRYDLCVWDDLVTRKTVRNSGALSDMIHWWQTEGETRVEPGGAMILQGQRIAPRDLYRWALDVQDINDQPKYRHVVYQAHNESLCTKQHDKKAKPWPDNCLLDPLRLPYRDVENIRRQDKQLFDIQYQQTDGTESSDLIQRIWLDGGIKDDEVYLGCYDRDREAGQVPDDAVFSLLSVDPSPSNWWAIQWWAIDPSRPTMWLVTGLKARMSNLRFLSYDLDTHQFSGVLHDFWHKSNDAKLPITQVIVEANAAQKWLTSQPYVQRWQQATGAVIHPHTTHTNKTDPQFGVGSVSTYFKQGAIRLPDADAHGRLQSKNLVDELFWWPNGATDDQVKALWFMVRKVAMEYAPQRQARPVFPRPSWLGSAGRGLPRTLRTGV